MNDKTIKRLLPCPFCGGPAMIELYDWLRTAEEGDDDHWTVGCDTNNCPGNMWRGPGVPGETGKRALIEAWNMRTTGKPH